jgi:hypothetical protein
MNILSTIVTFLKRFRYGANIDPVRDWLAMLSLSAVVLVGIIVWNVWAFNTVASGGVIGAEAPKALPTFNRASLDTIRTIFESRATEEAKYVAGVYRYADPSQ